MPVLVLLAMGALDFARVMYTYVALNSSAQAVAEYAGRNYSRAIEKQGSIDPCTNESRIPEPSKADHVFLHESGCFLELDSIVTPGPPGYVKLHTTNGGTSTVRMAVVDVTYRFTPLTPIVDRVVGEINIPVRATAPIEIVNPA